MTNEMSVAAWVSSGDSIGQNSLASSQDRGQLVTDGGVGIDTHHALGPGRCAHDDRSRPPNAALRATRRTPAEGRHYILSGLVHCSVCKRRMQAQWNHGRAYYRCRFPDDYPFEQYEHPKSLYVRDKALVTGLDRWLASLVDDDHIDHTCEMLGGSSERDRDNEEREGRLRQQIEDWTAGSTATGVSSTKAVRSQAWPNGSARPNANERCSLPSSAGRSRAASSPKTKSEH